MAEVAGLDIGNVALPQIDVTGFLSGTWMYIAIVGVVGFLLIIGVAILLFLKTYNRRVILFENISGSGYQPVLKTRARVIKLGQGGEEVLKTLAGGNYVSAYGRKMGKNTYWYCKGQDGYWYNIILGDLDTKFAMLDIEPIDRDVRMFHVSLDRLHHATYDKQNWFQKYAIHILLFLFLGALIFGMWIIIGQVGDATQSLAGTANTNKDVVASLDSLITKMDNINYGLGGTSGIVPAS